MDLKSYLSSPPILKPPILRKLLIFYVSVIDDSIGTVLAQHDEKGKERATYYLSKLFNEAEKKHTAIEKTCAGVVWVAQKLKHYFLAYEVQLIARMDPIKYLLKKPALTERLVRWQSFLSQFEITYVTQKAIKGYVIAEHLAHLPLPVFDEINL